MAIRGGFFSNGSFTGRSFRCGDFSRQSEGVRVARALRVGNGDRMGIKCPKRYYPSGEGGWRS